MQGEHLSRYIRLMSSLARDALAAAESAPVRAEAPGHSARLGIVAARALLDSTGATGGLSASAHAETLPDEPPVAPDALRDALNTNEPRYNDTLGFTRPVYHPLLVHLWMRSQCRINVQWPMSNAQCRTGMDEGLRRDVCHSSFFRHSTFDIRRSPHLALWWALCRYEVGEHAEARDATNRVLAAPGDDGALHHRGEKDQLDAWTWRELTGLHALTWLAELDGNDAWRQRVGEVADHHQRVTQPDYTTYQPWGIAAFAMNPDTTMFADQQLHDARTNLHTEGGGAGLLPGLLLADVVCLLRWVEDCGRGRS